MTKFRSGRRLVLGKSIFPYTIIMHKQRPRCGRRTSRGGCYQPTIGVEFVLVLWPKCSQMEGSDAHSAAKSGDNWRSRRHGKSMLNWTTIHNRSFLTLNTQISLQDFAKSAQGPPESIIFYRDGVSEGQFEQVRANEINAVQSMLPTTRLIILWSLTISQTPLIQPLKFGRKNITLPSQDPNYRSWSLGRGRAIDIMEMPSD